MESKKEEETRKEEILKYDRALLVWLLI
jgi:hypothetical protein